MKRPIFRIPSALLATQKTADCAVAGFRAKAEPDSPEYKPRVAEPVMRAIDSMPPAFRECVHEFGYIDVYHAWKRGWSPSAIRDAARDGAFHLPGL